MASCATLLSGMPGSVVNLLAPGEGGASPTTCVVVDGLGHSVEEEAGADPAGEQHGEPGGAGLRRCLPDQEALLYSGELPSGPSLTPPYLLT